MLLQISPFVGTSPQPDVQLFLQSASAIMHKWTCLSNFGRIADMPSTMWWIQNASSLHEFAGNSHPKSRVGVSAKVESSLSLIHPHSRRLLDTVVISRITSSSYCRAPDTTNCCSSFVLSSSSISACSLFVNPE